MPISTIFLFAEVFLIPLILAVIGPELIAAFYAKQIGRSFWFWFWISFVLPVISIIILMNLPDKIDLQKEEKPGDK